MNICSSTDAALAWLLSLPATCTSSPFRLPADSSPPNYTNSFTDWLQISPSNASPTRLTSSPLQDASFSSRVNYLQEPNSEFFSRYDLGFLNQSCAQTGASTSDSTLSASDTTSLDRMFS